MWLFTPIGFYSAVRKAGDAHLTVRARARADLDALRDGFAPTLSATLEGGGTDYPYRATIAAEDWAEAVKRMALAIDYPNFKDAVADRQGEARADAYHRVWAALLDVESPPARRRR